MLDYRDVIDPVDARHLFRSGFHVDVEGEDEVGGGFEGEEGAMRSVVRRMFAWSHERCCSMHSHSRGFFICVCGYLQLSQRNPCQR